MVDYAALFKIVSIFILALISPGPDFMIVSSMSLARGRTDGIKAAAGVASVVFLYTLISLTGTSALFAHYFWMSIAIKVCGGIYLLYLGASLWRNSLARKTANAVQSPVTIRKRNAYLAGALTCLTNPKAIAFFASIFALALPPNTNITTNATIGVTIPIITLAWYSCVAFGLSKGKVRARYQRWQCVIDRLTGTVLAFFGLKLILSVRS
jgi:threonine/homoserine/homoserine lactone efflux protein